MESILFGICRVYCRVYWRVYCRVYLQYTIHSGNYALNDNLGYFDFKFSRMLKVASVSELHMKERWSEVEHEQLSQGAPPNSRVLYCPLTSSTWDMLSWWVKLSSKDASDCWTVTFELWRAESARCWVHESCDRGRWGPWVWEQGQMAVHWVMDRYESRKEYELRANVGVW